MPSMKHFQALHHPAYCTVIANSSTFFIHKGHYVLKQYYGMAGVSSVCKIRVFLRHD